MLAVMSDVGPLKPFLGARVSVAALDGPELTVLAGPDEDLTRIAELLDGERIASGPSSLARLSFGHDGTGRGAASRSDR